MPQLKLLQGPVEEQAAEIYDMALKAMEEGRYSGAYRYFQEIERAVPGFRDVPERLRQADYARHEQRFLASQVGARGPALAAAPQPVYPPQPAYAPPPARSYEPLPRQSAASSLPTGLAWRR